MNAIPILGPPVWSPVPPPVVAGSRLPGTLYVVTDLQRAHVGAGLPVFVSEHWDRAVGVFQSHAPEFAECSEIGEPMMNLCEYRIDGAGWCTVRILQQRVR